MRTQSRLRQLKNSVTLMLLALLLLSIPPNPATVLAESLELAWEMSPVLPSRLPFTAHTDAPRKVVIHTADLSIIAQQPGDADAPLTSVQDSTYVWTWISGANTHSQSGVYGTRGVPAPGNIPGARWESISWIDAASNLWVMGGRGRDRALGDSHLNDLWRYDTNGQWSWMSGADTVIQAGVYGTQGVPAPGNVPGARSGSISWIDAVGNLWLLGGYGLDRDGNSGGLNDLWRYDANGQWTWMSGANTRNKAGVYGTRGVPAPGNVPGTRHSSISWIDAAGNLWLMGGSGYDTNGQWTWMSGANTCDQAGVYGIQGVPAPGNVPGTRHSSISWIDAAGNLWLLGGYGVDSTGNSGRLNDLWRYDANGQWTWMSGANTRNQAGVYGTRGVPAPGNVPGAREGSISWIDAAGNLWLLGGWGYDRARIGLLNDLWRYNANGQWTWMSGADTVNQAGVYGTQGVPAPGNVPGTRQHSISWIDAAGNLWLLGGYGYDRDGNEGYLNDLWRYGPPPPPLPAPAPFSITRSDANGNYLITWGTVAGATNYVLEEEDNPAFTAPVLRYTGSSTQFQVPNQPAGSFWYYRVKGTASDRDGSWSAIRAVIVGGHYIHLPLTLRDHITYFEVPWEVEPNDTWQQANGPLVSGRTYYGTFPSGADTRDYFSIYLRTPQSVELWLTNIGAGHNYDLILRNAALNEVGYSGNLDSANEHIRTPILPAGWYYIQVYNRGGTGNTQPYHLQVVHPAAAALTAIESELPTPVPLPTPAPPEP